MRLLGGSFFPEEVLSWILPEDIPLLAVLDFDSGSLVVREIRPDLLTKFVVEKKSDSKHDRKSSQRQEPVGLGRQLGCRWWFESLLFRFGHGRLPALGLRGRVRWSFIG